MSESLAGRQSGDGTWNLDNVPPGTHLPRREMRARREAAEAQAKAAADGAPSWTVAPAGYALEELRVGVVGAATFGAAVPLDGNLT